MLKKNKKCCFFIDKMLELYYIYKRLVMNAGD